MMSRCISHIEAKVNYPAVASAQNGPKCAACRGLDKGRSSGATGLLGIVPPACRTFLPRVPHKVSRATHKGVVMCYKSQ